MKVSNVRRLLVSVQVVDVCMEALLSIKHKLTVSGPLTVRNVKIIPVLNALLDVCAAVQSGAPLILCCVGIR